MRDTQTTYMGEDYKATRRGFLAGTAALLSGAAGCFGNSDGSSPPNTDETDTTTPTDTPTTTTRTTTETTTERPRADLLDMSDVGYEDTLDLPTRYSVHEEAYQSALNDWWPREEYALFRNTHEGAEVIGFSHAYAEGLKEKGVIDNYIANGDLQDHELNGAWKYAEEELDWKPEHQIIADTNVAIGGGLGAAAIEVIDLKDEWHGVSSIGGSRIVTDNLAEDVDTKLFGSVWPGSPDHDRDPMDGYTGDVVSGFNRIGMGCCVDNEDKLAVFNAVGAVDPNEAYTPGGYYSEIDVEGLERVGERILEMTGQNHMNRELANQVREMGNAGKEVLAQPENPNDRQEYLIRPAQNKYESQDRFLIPYTDLVIENQGDAP